MQPDRISTEEVIRRIDSGEEIVFVDARRRDAFDSSEEMIGGAIRVPPDDVAGYVSRLPPYRAIVVYCTCASEQSSMNVARELLERGFHEARPLLGGFEEWKRKKGFVVGKPAERLEHGEARA